VVNPPQFVYQSKVTFEAVLVPTSSIVAGLVVPMPTLPLRGEIELRRVHADAPLDAEFCHWRGGADADQPSVGHDEVRGGGRTIANDGPLMPFELMESCAHGVVVPMPTNPAFVMVSAAGVEVA